MNEGMNCKIYIQVIKYNFYLFLLFEFLFFFAKLLNKAYFLHFKIKRLTNSTRLDLGALLGAFVKLRPIP